MDYDVYVSNIKEKEVDFVAIKNDWTIYVQATYMLVGEQTIEQEYAPLECIADNYENVVVSLDDLQQPSRNGISMYFCIFNGIWFVCKFWKYE